MRKAPRTGQAPIDLLGADIGLDPRFRVLRRLIGAWEALDALQYAIGGIVFLTMGFGIWHTVVPLAKGPASARAARDAHDGMLWITVGIGTFALLIGAFGLYSGIRWMRHGNDGKWG